MGFSINSFVTGIVGAIVAVILLVTVAVPVISSNEVADTVANADSLNAMITIIPVLIAVGVIIAVVSMFLSKRD
jgi:uncharacterized membrane protein